MTHARTDFNIVLSDGTELWIHRDSAPAGLTELNSSDELAFMLAPFFGPASGSPENQNLDAIRLYAAGDTDRTPQFRRGEMVSLKHVDLTSGLKTTLFTGSIQSVRRS